jgi:uncharacterized protein YicC (UPF0701 family)
MILSMTGFAAVAAELPGMTLTVDLRSVNHRFLDVTVKLPDELRAIEPALRERLAAALRRGKVECRVAMNRATVGSAALAVDAGRVAQLANASVPPAALAQQVTALVDAALVELEAARSREGAKIAAMLDAACDGIAAQVTRVTPRIPAIHAAFSERLGTRLRDAGLDPNEDRLKQELAIFATKIDVAEELQRLTGHVTEVRRVLRAGGSAGKRLDFLAQELHREANTLGSKSVDVDVSQASLELKVLIEQMREQVQNVE